MLIVEFLLLRKKYLNIHNNQQILRKRQKEAENIHSVYLIKNEIIICKKHVYHMCIRMLST